MTTAQPDRIDQLESVIERVDRKLDAIATDLAEMKTDARVFQARTEERFNSIDQRFNSVDQRLGALEDRTKAQDSRLWTFVTALVLAALGTIAKLAFFPSA
jgi:septal ring factor EnvC (AmiA/AmiB activator)